MEAPEQTPGTVSKILWHFTGGPLWDDEKRRQNKGPKPAAQAFDNLVSILSSGELRLGSYKEVVRISIPERRRYDPQDHEYKAEKNALEELVSAPVCCLADVPIAHLSYLANRYGKFAIGFHREAVVRHGFNPVFYTLEDTRVIRSIYLGFTELLNVDADAARWHTEEMRESIVTFIAQHNLEVEPDGSALDSIGSEVDAIGDYVSEVKRSFEKFLGFVKTFSPKEFGTIYCEREWRSLSSYEFDVEALALVVVPKRVGKREYFSEFVQTAAKKLRIPRSVPIVPWEDLVEH